MLLMLLLISKSHPQECSYEYTDIGPIYIWYQWEWNYHFFHILLEFLTKFHLSIYVRTQFNKLIKQSEVYCILLTFRKKFLASMSVRAVTTNFFTRRLRIIINYFTWIRFIYIYLYNYFVVLLSIKNIYHYI